MIVFHILLKSRGADSEAFTAPEQHLSAAAVRDSCSLAARAGVCAADACFATVAGAGTELLWAAIHQPA